jgi:hypothetical protein
MSTAHPVAIGVLTSGGDAPGMNAALHAVVRTALSRDVAVYAIFEGYQGMVDGGDRIRSLTWDDVGGVMQQGGTVIGTALGHAGGVVAHGSWMTKKSRKFREEPACERSLNLSSPMRCLIRAATRR